MPAFEVAQRGCCSRGMIGVVAEQIENRVAFHEWEEEE